VSASNTAEAPAVSGQGVFLAGELFSVAPSKPYTKRDGTRVEPFTVAVAVGASLIRVEYETEGEATAAIRGAMKGDQVVIPVWVNGPWDADRGRSAPVSYRGRALAGA
jgi:hypothetical protein